MITFARAGGPPDNWYNIFVVDLENGQELSKVVECDVEKGYVIRYKSDANGDMIVEDGEPVKERIEGRFELRVKE